VEASEETSFGSLLAELDSMEQGLKTDFDDFSVADGDELTEAADEEELPRHS